MQCDKLALYMQAFFMSAYFVVLKYWYPCTPVYRLNGRTAFGCNVMSNGKGTDTFCYYVKKHNHFRCGYARLQWNVNPRNGYSIIQ